MLLLNNSLSDKKIFSIREGRPIATIIKTLIQPNNLKIEGFFVQDNISKSVRILLNQDIREINKDGFIVNDYDCLSEPKDLIRLTKIIEIDYNLINKPTVTVSGKKLGKISDFAFDTNNMFISKLYVSQSIIRNFNGALLSVDRNQIIEINDKKVIIDELEGTIKAAASVLAI